MNKILSVISMTALCMGFVACDEVEDSLSQPQTNPQEPIFAVDNIVVTPNADQLQLEAIAAEKEQAKVASLTVTDFPQASSLKVVMQLSKDADFTAPVNIPTTVKSAAQEAAEAAPEAKAEGAVYNIYADPAKVDLEYYLNVTHNPIPGKAYVRFAVSAVNGTETVRIGGPDTYYGEGAISLVPFKPEVEIETAYKLEGTEQKDFLHSATNVYDDPVFSVIIDVTAEQAAAGYEWYITNADGTKTYGPADPAEDKGKLEEGTAKGVITQPGPHSIKINMHELTYEVSLAIDQLYTPGNSNGWNQEASQMITTTDYMNYTGFAHLNGEFKFSSQPNWGGINYGSTGVEGELSADGGASNLNAPEDALYWVKVNLPEMHYALTPITSLGAIGDFNGWGSQTVFQPSADFLTWTGTVKADKAGTFKFRANDDWGINLGGTPDALVYDGPNLELAAGTYTITLDLSAVPYTCKIVKQ